VHYDLLVIGSGPAGQKGAINAAKHCRKVAVIDSRTMIGGCSLHLGTIPSKTLREAILYFSGVRQRAFYGMDYTLKDDISAADLAYRVHAVLEREGEVVRAQLKRNGVTTLSGLSRFIDPHTVEVAGDDGGLTRATADYVLIACGTRPAQPPNVAADGKRVFTSDQLLELTQLPRELIVVGGGIIGLEYAAMFTALNTRVTLIEQRRTLLDFADQEIVSALLYQLRSQGLTLRLGETVVSVSLDGHGRADGQGRVEAQLESGKAVRGDGLLYAVGRQGNADRLSLENAGLVADARGRIAVNEYFQTAVPHIYAAGDVVGFPALASTSMEQGRLATSHMFMIPGRMERETMPYGIYTIPEISMVGRTEEELTAAKVRYEVGVAKFRELARGQMIGDQIGVLKLLFDPVTLKVLGVHVIGEGATELVHIGQAVLALGGTLEYFRDAVFNYPTLAEAYKVAALSGLNKL
jgi:NAD(P) transhydrogenase